MPETKFTEVVRARLPAGSIDLIDEVLKGGELRSGFIRAAVAAELERRLATSVEVAAQTATSRKRKV